MRRLHIKAGKYGGFDVTLEEQVEEVTHRMKHMQVGDWRTVETKYPGTVTGLAKHLMTRLTDDYESEWFEAELVNGLDEFERLIERYEKAVERLTTALEKEVDDGLCLQVC